MNIFVGVPLVGTFFKGFLMTYKLSQITNNLDITFQGKEIDIDAIQTLKDATPSNLSFLSDSKYISDLAMTKAGAVLIEEKFADMLPQGTIALITDEPYLKLALASKMFTPAISAETYEPNIGADCSLSRDLKCGKDVTIGSRVTIMPGCYLGDRVTIADDTTIYPNVTIYHDCHIANRCIIHAGTVIGSDGYGFAHTKKGEHIKIYQNGNVIIQDDVEIGANCTIDRAALGSTILRHGTKIDNLIQIGHNCDIGEHSLMAGQSGVAGSSTLGRNTVLGGQAAVSGHLTLGDFTTIAGKAGVTKSLEGNETYAGFPAMPIRQWLKLQAKISSLIKPKKK